MEKHEIFEICSQVDSFIAKELTKPIVNGTSYDMLEAHHGIIPISRNCFCRKRRIVRKIMEKRMGRSEEEKNGQMRMDGVVIGCVYNTHIYIDNTHRMCII